jgi:hypothetical protein
MVSNHTRSGRRFLHMFLRQECVILIIGIRIQISKSPVRIRIKLTSGGLHLIGNLAPPLLVYWSSIT